MPVRGIMRCFYGVATGYGRTIFNYCIQNRRDVTSKVGDHVKIHEASPFFLVNLCPHQNKKNVMSTIMETMIFSSFLCIFGKY